MNNDEPGPPRLRGPRGPNRALQARLDALKGWTPTSQGGWRLLAPGGHPASPKWHFHRGSASSTALVRRSRLWAGQCEACGHFTVSTSTPFLQGLKCLNCRPKPVRSTGRNLYFAGRVPVGNELYMFYAKNLTSAEELALERGYHWVTSAWPGQGGKVIDLPTVRREPVERPWNCWAFALGDVPHEVGQKGSAWLKHEGSPVWEGQDGKVYAWYHHPGDPYQPNATNTATIPATAEATGTTPVEGPPLVSFDDFM